MSAPSEVQQLPVRVFLAGRSRTKGSLTGKPVRTRGGGMKFVQQDSEQSTAWKQSMVRQLRMRLGIAVGRVGGKVQRTNAQPYAGPVEVHRFFRFERGASDVQFTPPPGDRLVWPSHNTEWPTAMDVGDVDKLTRNLLDALVQGGVLDDDRWVIGGCELKRWCHEGERPGVEILVRPAGPWAVNIERMILDGAP